MDFLLPSIIVAITLLASLMLGIVVGGVFLVRGAIKYYMLLNKYNQIVKDYDEIVANRKHIIDYATDSINKIIERDNNDYN